MAILQSDWHKDTIWTEYHLTAAIGWIAGTVRTEKGRFERETLPPVDRVMTIRMFDRIPSGSAKPSEWSEIYWVANDQQTVELAQTHWGVLPYGAPPLSAASAAEHPELHRFLGAMRGLSRERAKGTRNPRFPRF